jgi:hypothetical protein
MELFMSWTDLVDRTTSDYDTVTDFNAVKNNAKFIFDSLIPVGISLPYDADHPALSAAVLSEYFAPASGQVISDTESIFNTYRVRNLNGADVELSLTWTADAGGAYATADAKDILAINKGDWVSGTGIAANSMVKNITGNVITITDIAATGAKTITDTHGNVVELEKAV